MANNFQSSFIPKGVGSYTPTETSRKSGAGFFGLIALVLFLGSLLTTLGLIGYKQVVKSSIGNLKAELALAEESIDTTTIDTMFSFSKKLSASREVVVRHKAVSNFLSLLAENTVQTILFDNLSYQFMPDGSLSVVLAGTALNYSSLALQESVMAKIKEVKKVEFSELSAVEGGKVSFKMTITADPSVSIYKPEADSEAEADGQSKTSATEEVTVSGLEEIDLSMPNLDDI